MVNNYLEISFYMIWVFVFVSLIALISVTESITYFSEPQFTKDLLFQQCQDDCENMGYEYSEYDSTLNVDGSVECFCEIIKDNKPEVITQHGDFPRRSMSEGREVVRINQRRLPWELKEERRILEQYQDYNNAKTNSKPS